MSKPHRIPKRWLGAFRVGHRSSAREFIDEELSYELLAKAENGCKESESTLDYITKFNNEFHKNVIKKNDPKALHNTNELRKDCYNRENSRNRDVMSMSRKIAVNNPFDTNVNADEHIKTSPDNDGLTENKTNGSRDLDHESHIVELLDLKQSLSKPQ